MALTATPKDNPAVRHALAHIWPTVLAAEPFRQALEELELTSLDAVFAFEGGTDMAKKGLGRFRRRLHFELTPAGSQRPVRVFLKRYDRPPVLRQLRHWLEHRKRASFGVAEHETASRLAEAGIRTPVTVACGQAWGLCFERASFLMTEEVAGAASLEQKRPACFEGPATQANVRARRDFIVRLAEFVRRFHATGYRHRDLYLCHIFHSERDGFCLIDLARAFRPLLSRRFRLKDLAQLHYSAPGRYVTRTDRLRFFLAYSGHERLSPQDKACIRAVVRKANAMARHSRRHGIPIPFQSTPDGR